MSELKPCPFCGGTNIKLLVFEDSTCYVQCKDCRITVEVKIDVRIAHDDINTRKKVLANIWNTREYKEEINEENN